MVKGERIITDSTLIDADASLDSMVLKEPKPTRLDFQIEDNSNKLPELDIKLSNKTHISKTDQDSSLAKKSWKY